MSGVCIGTALRNEMLAHISDGPVGFGGLLRRRRRQALARARSRPSCARPRPSRSRGGCLFFFPREASADLLPLSLHLDFSDSKLASPSWPLPLPSMP